MLDELNETFCPSSSVVERLPEEQSVGGSIPSSGTINKKMYNLVSPVGGFGNHLRWMLLLSNEFTWDHYNIVDIHDKIKFLNNKVYFPGRSWHNWLKIEWLYRNKFNSLFRFSHDTLLLRKYYQSAIFNKQKSIVLTSSPELCLRVYLKFNSSLNNEGLDGFKSAIVKHNRIVNKFLSTESHVLALNSDLLYSPILDKSLYNSCIEFLKIEDCYQHANAIHNVWYRLHLTAEKDMRDFISKMYSDPYNASQQYDFLLPQDIT